MDTSLDSDPLALPDPRSYASAVFPLREHPLYGSAATLGDCAYLMPADLAEYTQAQTFAPEVTNLEICPACFFNTSGTTSRSKRIPYSDADLERQRVHEAIALRKLGMGPGDGVISLGAPLPSISGWAIVNGSQATGAMVLNTSQLDYEGVFARGQQAQATTVIGTPLVVKEIGLAIAEEFGPLRQSLPNLRTGIIFGDVLPEALRREIRELWGFAQVYSLYGTVEADVVATECPAIPGEMALMLERLIFEIIPEGELARERREPGYQPRAFDVNDVANDTIGEIVISDLSRDIFPLIRYRIGDIVKLHRNTGEHNRRVPSISVLGRSRNVVLLDGVPLYEVQLNAALEHALGARVIDWRLIERADQACRFELFIEARPGATRQPEDRDAILAALRAQRPELAMVPLDRLVDVVWTEKLEQGEIQGDAKARRIVLLAA